MENRDRGLVPQQPETEKVEPGSPEATVNEWMKEYTKEREGRAEEPYQIPAEVKTWFEEREQKLKALDIDTDLPPKAWRQAQDEFEEAYQAKMKLPEYQLYELQRQADPNERKIRYLEKKLKQAAEEKWWEENKESVPPRNLRTHFKETATALADIEGLGWAQHQAHGHQSLLEVLRQVEKNKPTGDGSEYNIAEIYGSGGYNRWFVDEAGNVKFSASHGIEVGLTKEELAQKMARRGFEIF